MYAAAPPNSLVRNRYRVVELVGRGGAGVVYRALDEVTNESVAIKHLLAISSVAWTRFQVEASLLARVRHPSIAESRGVWVEAGKQLMLMRYVPGLDLGAQLALHGARSACTVCWTGPSISSTRWDICMRAASCITTSSRATSSWMRPVAQSCSILVSPGRCVRRLPTSHLATPPAMLHQSRSSGTETDARSDLYALGATLYQLLVWQSPSPR